MSANTLEEVECAQCCISFGVTDGMLTRRRKDGVDFYCPNGHANVFKQEPAEKKIVRLVQRVKDLEEMLAAAQKEICALASELSVWKPRSE